MIQQLDEVLQGHGAQVLSGAVPDRDSAILHVPVSHHQHIGDFLHGGLADLLADLLIAAVHLYPEAPGIQRLLQFLGIAGGPVCNGQYLDLHRGEPCRESSREMLRNDADKSLNGA